MEAGTEFVPSDFTRLSRSPRPVFKRKVYDDIFQGRLSLALAQVEGVKVYRFSVLPKGESAMPSTHALAPGSDIAFDVLEGDARLGLAKVLSGCTFQQSLRARFEFSFPLAKTALCLGLGERYSSLNLRGARHTLCSTDNPNHDESSDSLYKAIPFSIFLDDGLASACFLDSAAPQIYDLDSELDGQVRIELLSARGFSFYYFDKAPLSQIVAAFTALTGRSELPPLWALGHQQSRWSYPDAETVRDLAREFRRRRIPCDTLVLDIDYMDDYRVFTSDKGRFPDFKGLIEELARDNFRMVTIVDPGVKLDKDYKIYQEGLKLDLFCRDAKGEVFVDRVWPGRSVFPDFQMEATRKWWAEKLQFYYDNGVSGIWNDMNEPAFFDTRFIPVSSFDELPETGEQPFLQRDDTDGEPTTVGHLEVRNLYGSMMCEATYNAALAARPGERPFVLTRSAFAGIQRHAAVWLGDNKSWWEHLRKSLPMLLNVGLSGVPFAGVDIGGFGETCSPEMLLRWYEVGIFFPFFRNHCWLKGRAQEPFAYGAAVEEKARRLIELRYSLLPYISGLFHEHRQTGAPLMRPLLYHYPQDAMALNCHDQFMFGADILVAPVMERAQTHRYVYLPEAGSQWTALADDKTYEGGRSHYLEMPLGTCPAFVREGAILPFADAMQSTGEYEQAAITFKVYGQQGSAVFFEDDGKSFDYKEGGFAQWQLAYSDGFLSRLMGGHYKTSRRYFLQKPDGSKIPVQL